MAAPVLQFPWTRCTHPLGLGISNDCIAQEYPYTLPLYRERNLGHSSHCPLPLVPIVQC